MNAIRQILSPLNGKIMIDIPKEYQQQQFEVILLPIEDADKQVKLDALGDLPNEPSSLKDPEKLAMAHKIIDLGTSVSHNFISDFELNKQDRTLPFSEQ